MSVQLADSRRDARQWARRRKRPIRFCALGRAGVGYTSPIANNRCCTLRPPAARPPCRRRRCVRARGAGRNGNPANSQGHDRNDDASTRASSAKANAKPTFCSARIIVTPALSRIASDRGFRLASMGASRGHNDPNSSLAGYSSANLDHSLRPLDRQNALCRSPIGWVLPISDGHAPMRSRGPRPRLVLRLHALNPETERADHL